VILSALGVLASFFGSAKVSLEILCRHPVHPDLWQWRQLGKWQYLEVSNSVVTIVDTARKGWFESPEANLVIHKDKASRFPVLSYFTAFESQNRRPSTKREPGGNGRHHPVDYFFSSGASFFAAPWAFS
jgi:hypothetical protein